MKTLTLLILSKEAKPVLSQPVATTTQKPQAKKEN